MIKLIDLLKEAEDKPLSPAEAGALGFILGKPGEKELFKKGFTLKDIGTDPVTGAITHQVIKLPMFDKLRQELNDVKTQIQPFKLSSNEDIKKLATQAVKGLIMINNIIFAIEQNIKLIRQENFE